jgi:hypothetical protein
VAAARRRQVVAADSPVVAARRRQVVAADSPVVAARRRQVVAADSPVAAARRRQVEMMVRRSQAGVESQLLAAADMAAQSLDRQVDIEWARQSRAVARAGRLRAAARKVNYSRQGAALRA